MTENRLEYFKLANYIAGTALIILGILGFIPAVTPNGMIFGLFMVNTPHNCVHLAVGSLMLIAGKWPNRFTIFIIVLIGFAFTGLAIFGFFSPLAVGTFNTIDNLLHVCIAFFAFIQGWLVAKVTE